jgi:hypothetical protein
MWIRESHTYFTLVSLYSPIETDSQERARSAHGSSVGEQAIPYVPFLLYILLLLRRPLDGNSSTPMLLPYACGLTPIVSRRQFSQTNWLHTSLQLQWSPNAAIVEI